MATSAPKTSSLWPLAIVGAFALFILGIVTLIIAASSQRADLVSADYYEQEVRYQDQIERLRRTEPFDREIQAKMDAAAGSLVISLPAAHAGRNPTGWIRFYRPDAARLDQEFVLNPDAQGRQQLSIAGMSAGLWKVRLEWTVDREEFYADRQIVIPRPAGQPPA